MRASNKVSRHIPVAVQCELWGRAAGRCEFHGCNRRVYLSDVTHERVNISEKAHIHSFAEGGPRGRGPLATNPAALNRIDNLMLLCEFCHRKIDKRKDGGRYPATILRQWKALHENRVTLVTAISPDKNSHVVLYGANVGSSKIDVQPENASGAIFPERYPASETPIHLNMSWEGRDHIPGYWKTEEENLLSAFKEEIGPRIKKGDAHFSLFGFAPMPLLIRLGILFTDRVPVDVFQRHREPAPTWSWPNIGSDLRFRLIRPRRTSGRPVLIVSLSARIAPARVLEIVGRGCSVWELLVDKPHNDILKTRAHLSDFRAAARHALAQIGDVHGFKTPLSIFPAMPVSAAVELGRVRMPKASMPWVIYDHNQVAGRFVKTLDIGG